MQQAGKRARKQQLRWAETPAAARPRAMCVSWSCCLSLTLSGQPPLYIFSSRWRCCASRSPLASRLKFSTVRPWNIVWKPASVCVMPICPPVLCRHTPRWHCPRFLFYCFCPGRIFRSLCTGGWSVCQAAFQATSHNPHTFIVRTPVCFDSI